jgi:branched-chain amino acid transport system substrate-binding protein
MNIFRTLLVIAVVLCTFANATGARAAQPPFEFNVLVPETGTGAFLGKSYEEALAGLEIAINSTGGIRGRPIKFVVSDSQTSGQVGLQIVNGLIAKHVSLFVDGGPSPVCNSSIPLIDKSGPLDYCLSPLITPAPRSYVFSSSASANDLAAVAIRFLRNKGLKRLAVIQITDSTGQAYERAVAVAMSRRENAGVQLVASEHFNAPDISVAAQLTRIAAAKPDALMIWATGSPLGTVLHGLKDGGYSFPVITSNSNMTYAQMASYESVMPKVFYFPSLRSLLPAHTHKGPLRDAQSVWVNSFAKLKIRPDSGHSLMWDAVMVFVDALRHAGPSATSEQLRDYILAQHSWVGTNGVYDFASGDQRGLGDGAIVMARWDAAKGTWVQVSAPKGALQ